MTRRNVPRHEAGKPGRGARMIFETERLFARKLTRKDFQGLCRILQDPEVMYPYEHAFSDGEVTEWLERQLLRYEKDGFGLWAVILKKTGQFIGQCGLTMQDWDGGCRRLDICFKRRIGTGAMPPKRQRAAKNMPLRR